jgi:predicted N-formylglutamate amidohydrolase
MLRLLLTCEHGGNYIPATYATLFEKHQELLASHQGYDIGAKELFLELKDLAQTSFCADTSRLLVEMNRSLHHKKLFSDITKELPESEKQKILQEHYFPYREKVEDMVQDFIMAGRRVLHIAVHTFTPVLNGQERQGDIGLLYDPKRCGEQTFCRAWKKKLQQLDPDLLVRYNYPYLGISDGFPTYLRRKFTDQQYIGIELEVNQKFAEGEKQQWQRVQHLLKESLEQVLQPYRLKEQEEERS